MKLFYKIKGHNPTLRPVSCGPDTIVMFIFPYQLFYVEYHKDGFPKFVLSPTIFIWLAIILGTTNIRIHGYIKRQIKQIGTEGGYVYIMDVSAVFLISARR